MKNAPTPGEHMVERECSPGVYGYGMCNEKQSALEQLYCYRLMLFLDRISEKMLEL